MRDAILAVAGLAEFVLRLTFVLVILVLLICSILGLLVLVAFSPDDLRGGFAVGTRLPEAQGETSATAEAVKRLRARSGLTWDELARAFGVSRRTVHAWASGSKLNQAHAARLSLVTQVIDGLATDSPDRTRAALHAPTAAGESPYQRLIRSLAQPGNRREGFAPWELLAGGGAPRDESPH